MGTKVQINRTGTDNSPPAVLLEGELSVEMGVPTRLWVGVPPALDPASRKLLFDSSAAANYYTKAESDANFVNVPGDTMTGQLTMTDAGGNTGAIGWGNTGTAFTRWDGTNYNITMNVSCTGSITAAGNIVSAGNVSSGAAVTVGTDLFLTDNGVARFGTFGHVINRDPATGGLFIGGGQANIDFNALNPVFVRNALTALLAPVNPDHVVRKMDLDAVTAGLGAYVLKAGDIMTGTLGALGFTTRPGTAGALGGNNYNINWTGAVADLWIDATNVGSLAFNSTLAGYVLKTGDTMTGSLTVPTVYLNATNYETTDGTNYIVRTDGSYILQNSGGSANRFVVDAAGNATIPGAAYVAGRITGNGDSIMTAPGGAVDAGLIYFGSSGAYRIACTAGAIDVFGVLSAQSNWATLPKHVVTLDFLQAYTGAAGSYVLKTGDTMSGTLTVPAVYLNATNYETSDGTNYLIRTNGQSIFQNAGGATLASIDNFGNFVGAGGFFSSSVQAGANVTAAANLISSIGTCILNSPGGNDTIYFNGPGGALRAQVFWNSADNGFDIVNQNAVHFRVYAGGGSCELGTGFNGMAGIAAPGHQVNVYNLNYDGAGGTQLWIDASNFGNISLVSDYRIKKDVAPLPSMWETVKTLKPISYTHQDFVTPADVAYRANLAQSLDEQGDFPESREKQTRQGPTVRADDIERWGFIAHELQEALVPSAASAEKDAPDALQAPNPWTVIAALTKALQEAMAKIEELQIHTGLATPR